MGDLIRPAAQRGDALREMEIANLPEGLEVCTADYSAAARLVWSVSAAAAAAET